jgi:hypothetical protein
MRPPRAGSRWSGGRVRRRSRYATYLASDEWFARRARWYFDQLAVGRAVRCQVCGQAWTLDQGDLHHRTYDHLGHEHHGDLVPLCRTHHAALHQIWDGSPAWRRLGRTQATAGIITALRQPMRQDHHDH